MSRTTLGLIVLACCALSLRVGLTLALSTRHDGPLTYEHGEIAANLLAGRGFSVTFLGTEGPTSQQAPLYPLLLAGCYACCGVGTHASILCVQLLQCLAGTALVLCVVWLAWSLFPERPAVGWVAGAGAALYPSHVYMVTHVQVAVWAALALTLLLAVVFSPRWSGTWKGAALAGLLSGLLLLIDPILAAALPFAAFVVARAASRGAAGASAATFNLRRWFNGLLRSAAMAAIALAVVLPWIWRNYCVHGEFVFVKSTFGYALWQGNNPASWGTDKVPKASAEALRRRHDGTLAGIDRAMWEARHETLYIDDVLLKPSGYREFAGLTEPQRSRLLGRRAWDFIRSRPADYFRLCRHRLRYFLLFDETNPKTANPVYRLSTIAWLALAGAGALCLGRAWRRAWPLLGVFAAVALFHTLTIVSARFRIPVEPLTFPWAAWAVTCAAGRVWAGRETEATTGTRHAQLNGVQPACRDAA